MKQLLIDIEVYRNYFLLGCKDYQTKEIISFEIGEHKDQRKELSDFLRNYKDFWISFNGIGYDNVVLAYGQQNKWWLHEDALYACNKLKEFSDSVINTRNSKKSHSQKEIINLFSGFDDSVVTYENIKSLIKEDIDLENQWYAKFSKYIGYFKFVDVDLYLYWARMLRISKKISLKSLGIQLGYPIVQELPFPPDMILEEEHVKELKYYNLQHDLGILDLLCKSKEEDIKQRSDAQSKYGFPCFSWDGVKLGQNILLKTLCDKTGMSIDKISNLRSPMNSVRIGDIILDKINFVKTPVVYTYKKNEIICNSFYSLLQHLNNRVVTTTTELSYSVITNGVKYDIKSGGLHSYHNNDLVEPNLETHCYRDVDVSSYYPSFGSLYRYVPQHLPQLYEVLNSFRIERITDKKEGRMADANLKKLALNGGYYGNLNNEYSPLYDPKQMLSVTINGQLFLLMLCEKFMQVGIQIDMVNTDGVTVIFPKELESEYIRICKWWEELTGMELEEAVYKKVIRSNINNYIAVGDKIKRKGLFKFETKEIPLGDSVDFLIIPKLLNEYFINGVSPEESIKLDKWHIYDFCCSMKVDRTYSVEWNLKTQQRLNRFYVSERGSYLYKCRGGKKAHMLKGWGVQLYNKHEDKSLDQYNIDYRYYISEVRKIISTIENHNQLQLF